jgi:hypothetical protein
MTYYHGLIKKREKGLTIIITIKKNTAQKIKD